LGVWPAISVVEGRLCGTHRPPSLNTAVGKKGGGGDLVGGCGGALARRCNGCGGGVSALHDAMF
jgi:hypothetical protein